MPVKAIVFDGFNTLFGAPNRTPFYESVFVGKGISPSRIYPPVRDHIMSRSTGTHEEVTLELGAHLGLVDPSHARDLLAAANLWKQWTYTIQWLPGAVALLQWIRKHTTCRTVLMTNIITVDLDILAVTLDLWSHFDFVWASCQQGQSKRPDALQCWQTIEEWLLPGVWPNEIMMVGDKPDDDLAVPQLREWSVWPMEPDGSSIPAFAQHLSEMLNIEL